MRTIEGVRPSASVDRDIMPRCVANTAPEVRRNRRQIRLGWKRARLIYKPFLVPPQARMTVHAVELERHPVRSQITLFKDECPDPTKSRDAACRDMIGAAIS